MKNIENICCLLLIGFIQLSKEQRVAPGVAPGHYDPNQQQHHQQQQQFQPPPIQQQQQQQHQPPQHQQQQQFQQPPQQNFQQQQQPPQHQQQQQQQPPRGGHGHAGGHAQHHAPHHGVGQNILDASNVAQEREHIQEHMDVPIDTSKMTEQELQFHYFKMHDTDNNNKLDGCELVKSLIHWHDQSNHDPSAGQPIPDAKVFQDDELVNMIDPILQNDDKNKDGFIDYGEFVQDHEGEEPMPPLEDQAIENVVDQVLEHDLNDDGLISYPEFVRAQKVSEKIEEKKKKKCTTCGDD